MALPPGAVVSCNPGGKQRHQLVQEEVVRYEGVEVEEGRAKASRPRTATARARNRQCQLARRTSQLRLHPAPPKDPASHWPPAEGL